MSQNNSASRSMPTELARPRSCRWVFRLGVICLAFAVLCFAAGHVVAFVMMFGSLNAEPLGEQSAREQVACCFDILTPLNCAEYLLATMGIVLLILAGVRHWLGAKQQV